MFIEGFLPDWFADLLGNPPLHRTDYRGDRRGGYHPPAGVGFDTQNEMDVIGHNAILIYNDVFIMGCNL